MTVKEIEARTGLPRASVRFYEAQGLLCPGRGENGYRNYGEEDVTLLLKIKLLRQLDCSLEDIRALQTGERPLDAVLEARLTELEHRHAQLDQAKRLCEKLREDRADWAGLDPARYLSWDGPGLPAADQIPDQRFTCPWRRYFARWLDYGIYVTLWQLVLGGLLRVSVLHRSVGGKVADAAAALILMAVLEPFLLHLFAATPGKFLLGLRLTRSDGSRLSLTQGFQRTAVLIVTGLGLQIPLFSTVTLFLGWQRCKKGEDQPWELADEAYWDGADGRGDYWGRRGSKWKLAGFLAVWALITVLTLGAERLAATPRYQGAMTAERFAANYNQLLAYDTAPDSPAIHLLPDGRWKEPSSNTLVIYAGGQPPADFSLEARDGLLTGVSFHAENNQQDFFSTPPISQMSLTLRALLTGRPDVPKGELEEALKQLVELWDDGGGRRQHTIQAGAAHISVDVALAGYEDGAVDFMGGLALLPKEGETQRMTVDFAVKLG